MLSRLASPHSQTSCFFDYRNEEMLNRLASPHSQNSCNFNYRNEEMLSYLGWLVHVSLMGYSWGISGILAGVIPGHSWGIYGIPFDPGANLTVIFKQENFCVMSTFANSFSHNGS